MNKLRIAQLKQVQQYKSTDFDQQTATMALNLKHRLTIPNLASASGTKSPMKHSNKSSICKKSLSGASNGLAGSQPHNLRVN